MKRAVASKSRKTRQQAGVTLIELLIAVTLVSLLAVGILFAMRVGLNAMDRSGARLMGNRRVASVERILESQVAAIMPVPALCMPGQDAPPAKVMFFQGEPTSMRFVSAYSLHEAWRGMPLVLEYQVIPGNNGEGVRLIVNERLYTGPKGVGAFCTGVAPDETGAVVPHFVPIEIGPASFVLADKLAYCRFSYRFLPPQAPTDHVPAQWLPLWNKPILPSGIRIDMGPLRPDPAALQPVSLSIPVHVTRWPLGTYGY